MNLNNFKIIRTKGQLRKLGNKLMTLEEFAFDTETNTLRVNSYTPEFKLVGISISWGVDNNYYIPTGHRYTTVEYPNMLEKHVRKYLKEPFERLDVRIIGWNIKFDMHVLQRIGMTIKTPDLWDGMIMSWLCDENSPNGLKETTYRIWGEKPLDFKSVTNKVSDERRKENGLKKNSRIPFSLVDIEDGAKYAVDDSFNTFRNYLYLLDELESEDMEEIYIKMYQKFLHTLFIMEELGVPVNKSELKRLGEEIVEDLDQLMYDLVELAGVEFNPASNQHLAELIFGYDESKNPNDDILLNTFDLTPITRTPTGVPQCNNDTLKALLKKPNVMRNKKILSFISKLLEHKKLNKLHSAFIEGLNEQIYPDGRVHPNCNIIGTDSGRISMSEPNLQQLPKAKDEDKYQIRSLFIGSDYLVDEDGQYVCEESEATEYELDFLDRKRKKIIALDFKNLEMVILTHFSEDENLLDTFLNDRDSHGATAVNMFKLDCDADECKAMYPVQRQVGKVLNFLLVYGGGEMALVDILLKYGVNLGDKKLLKEEGCRSAKELARKYIDQYFDTYEGVSEFVKLQKKLAHRQGFVQTLIGRKRRLPHLKNGGSGSRKDFATVAYEERLSVNAPVQGSAGDITINAQNRVMWDDKYLVKRCIRTGKRAEEQLSGAERLKEMGCKMLIQVHDELVFECPEEYASEAIPILVHYMTHPFGDKKAQQLILPLRVDYDMGNTYQEAK